MDTGPVGARAAHRHLHVELHRGRRRSAGGPSKSGAAARLEPAHQHDDAAAASRARSPDRPAAGPQGPRIALLQWTGHTELHRMGAGCTEPRRGDGLAPGLGRYPCVRGEYSRMRLRSAIVLCAVILFAMPALRLPRTANPTPGRSPSAATPASTCPAASSTPGSRPDVLLEFYITGRLSIRGMGAWASNGADNEIDSAPAGPGHAQRRLELGSASTGTRSSPPASARYMLQARASGVDVGSMRTHAGVQRRRAASSTSPGRRSRSSSKRRTTAYSRATASPARPAWRATVGMKKYF